MHRKWFCINLLHVQYLQAPDLWPHTCVGAGRFWSVCLCWCRFCWGMPVCCLHLCSWHMSHRYLKKHMINDNMFHFILSECIVYIILCNRIQIYFLPSLQERLNVSVGSISFLILMRASRTIGPQLYQQERVHRLWHYVKRKKNSLTMLCS